MNTTNRRRNKRFKNIIDLIKGTITNRNLIPALAFAILFVLFSIIYFKYNLVLFPDSGGYYDNARIILGKLSIQYWRSVRGFGYPLILAINRIFFGDTLKGYLFGNYIYYLVMNGIIYYLMCKFLNKEQCSNKWVYKTIFWVIFPFNIISFGYNHTMLTEAVVPTLFLVAILMCFKWIYINFKANKTKCIIYAASFSLLGILIWFIKQPYLPAYIMTVGISSILGGIIQKSWKVFFQKLLVVFVCFVSLVLSIKTWDVFISKHALSASDINSTYMASSIFGGTNVYYYRIPDDISCSIDYVKKAKINKKAKNVINKIYKKDKKNWCNYFEIYDIVEGSDKYITSEVLLSDDSHISITERVLFLTKNLFKHPKYIIKSYIYNYLAISDIQGRDFSNGYRSNLLTSQYSIGENGTNGIYTFTLSGKAAITIDTEALHHFIPQAKENNARLTEGMLLFFQFDQFLFRFSMLLIIPVLIAGIIRFFRYKDERSVIIVLLSFLSFINVGFHVFTGAIIDRYIYPVYPLILLAIILIIIPNKPQIISFNSKKRGDKKNAKTSK